MSLTYSINQPGQVGSRSVVIAMIIGIHVVALMAFNSGIGHFFKSEPPPPPIKYYEFKDNPVPPEPVILPAVPTAVIDQHIDVPVVDQSTINIKIDPIVDVSPIAPSASVIQADAVKEPVATRLSVLNRVDPMYPAGSEAAGHQGTVLLDVQIDTRGHVMSVGILQSSGFNELDIAATKAVKQWHFSATPSGAHVHVPIKFQLNTVHY